MAKTLAEMMEAERQNKARVAAARKAFREQYTVGTDREGNYIAIKMEWFDDPDQRLIDATLDERIAQIMEVQVEIFVADPKGTEYGCPPDSLIAYDHLHADIAMLQPMSCVPF